MLTAQIRRYKADITITPTAIIEENQRTLGIYKETRDTSGVRDIGEFTQKFIRDMGQKVYNSNRAAEDKARRDKAKTIEKLVIYKIN